MLVERNGGENYFLGVHEKRGGGSLRVLLPVNPAYTAPPEKFGSASQEERHHERDPMEELRGPDPKEKIVEQKREEGENDEHRNLGCTCFSLVVT